MKEKLLKLQNRIKAYEKGAVAYSGGVDSAFLLKVAHDLLGDKVAAVTILSPLMPAREWEESDALCKKENIRHIKITMNPLEIEGFKENPENRCYLCKKHIFSLIKRELGKEGIENIFEGSNADDTKDYRPGMKALEELGIISPLKDAGLTKNEIRALSKEMGLLTWDKPSFACLASRIPYGDEINEKKLSMIEAGEEYLHRLGFKQYRLRCHGEIVRIELLREDLKKAVELSEDITKELTKLGFVYVTLDLSGFHSGSMNKTILKSI